MGPHLSIMSSYGGGGGSSGPIGIVSADAGLRGWHGY